jgi:hypothetical protein
MSCSCKVRSLPHSHVPRLHSRRAVPRTGPDSISTAFLPIEIAIFRHEFITIFRFSHNFLLHPSDILILERIDESSTLYEEDSGTVFLAKDVVEHLQNMTLAGMKKDARERRRASHPPAARRNW